MPRSERRLLTVSERRLLTVLFTDIVGSTDLAVEMGDARWRELIARHHRIVREELKRSGGREIDTAGDGFFATFDKPTQAIRCAASVVERVRTLGIEIRAGLHLGEVEIAGKKVGGVAVHTGARVLAAASPGEILVTGTLKELVSGAGFGFADRGSHALKGIPGEWHLHALTSVDGVSLGSPLDAPTAAERRDTIAAPTLLRRRKVPVAIAAGFALLLVAAIMLVRTGSPEEGGDRRAESPPLNSVLKVDPYSGAIQHIARNALQRHGGGNPKLAVGEGGVWIRSRNLVHIDPATGQIEGDPLHPLEISVIDPLADRGVEVGFRTVWIGGIRSPEGVGLLRWNPATDELLPEKLIPTDAALTDIALGHGSVWLTFVDGQLFRLDPDTIAVEKRISVGGSLDGVVVGAGGVWVLDIAGGTVTRVDPRTNAVDLDEIGFTGSVLGFAADDDRVWLLEVSGNDVIPVNADGVVGDPISVGDDPSGIAVGLGAVWVSDEGGDIYRIDALTKETSSFRVGGHLTAIAVDEDTETLWLTVGGD